MKSSNDELFEVAMEEMRPYLRIAFERGRALGHEQGFAEGYQAGEMLGYIQGVNDMKPALSDGLRCGSSKCGQAMQGLKNLGLDSPS